MFLLIIVSILLGDLAWWLWADHRVRRTRHPRLWRTLIGVWSGLLLGYLVWFILFRATARHAHQWMPIWTLGIVYVWHLLVLPATLLFIMLEGIVKLALKGRRQVQAEDASPVISRRQMLGAALAAAPPLLTIGATGIALHRVDQFRVRRIELAFPQLPPQLDGMTIAHVTDLHVGRFTRPRMLPAIADAINNLRSDLVLFTGDLIDLSMSDLPAGMDFLRRLDPRSGLFLCEGNHDLFEDPDGFEFGLRKNGFALLLNEGVITSVRDMQIQVLGLKWRRGEAGINENLKQVTHQRRDDLFQILLAHHPHAFDPAAAMGIPLTLAGHTHGGQLMLNERLGAGPAMFRYWSGAYRKNDSAIVVSNGVGNWFPLRINAPAEIVHLTLHHR